MQTLRLSDSATGDECSVEREEFALCPKRILKAGHWIGGHKIEECGGSIYVPPKTKPQEKSMPYYEDKELSCKELDCPNDGAFIFTGGEQRFLHNLVEQGATDKQGRPILYIEPKRCPECRARMKNRKANR